MKTNEAIQAFGSIKELAAALAITQPAIYQWGEDVPLLRAYQISELLAARSAERTTESKAA